MASNKTLRSRLIIAEALNQRFTEVNKDLQKKVRDLENPNFVNCDGCPDTPHEPIGVNKLTGCPACRALRELRVVSARAEAQRKELVDFCRAGPGVVLRVGGNTAWEKAAKDPMKVNQGNNRMAKAEADIKRIFGEIQALRDKIENEKF